MAVSLRVGYLVKTIPIFFGRCETLFSSQIGVRPYFQHIGVDCGSETRAGQIMVGDQPTNPGAPGTQSQVPPVNSALEKILNTFTRVA